MSFNEWIDDFMDEEEKVHFLDAGLMKSAWNAAIDEAVKVAENNDTGAGTDVDGAGYEIANKIKKLKE